MVPYNKYQTHTRVYFKPSQWRLTLICLKKYYIVMGY
jgi:hypothetical protein